MVKVSGMLPRTEALNNPTIVLSASTDMLTTTY